VNVKYYTNYGFIGNIATAIIASIASVFLRCYSNQNTPPPRAQPPQAAPAPVLVTKAAGAPEQV